VRAHVVLVGRKFRLMPLVAVAVIRLGLEPRVFGFERGESRQQLYLFLF